MRYIRQETLLGKRVQRKISATQMVIVGVGAIGTVAAELAVRAGFGKVTLIDRDVVEMSNLQRQVLFTEHDVGLPKAWCAAEQLRQINSDMVIRAVTAELNQRTRALLNADIILDCTDNIQVRLLINDYATQHNIPWIYGAAIRTVAAVFPSLPGKACFRCIHRTAKELKETCATEGIIGSAAATAAARQVALAMKIAAGEKVESVLQHVDVWSGKQWQVRVKKRRDCSADNTIQRIQKAKPETALQVTALCGGQTYQIKGKKQPLRAVATRLRKHGAVKQYKSFVKAKYVLVFADGRTIVHASSPQQAERRYALLLKK